MLALLWTILLLLFGIPVGLLVGAIETDSEPLEFHQSVYVGQFLANGSCETIIEHGAIMVAAMLPVCDGEPNEVFEPNQGTPEIQIPTLEPVGTSVQGFDVSYTVGDVYVCTNHCERWVDHVVVIDIPEGGLSEGSEAVMVAYMVDMAELEKTDFIDSVLEVTVSK